MSWSTFIKAHWGTIAATDLFTVEVVNPFGLVRYHVLFVIDIATRCVCHVPERGTCSRTGDFLTKPP